MDFKKEDYTSENGVATKTSEEVIQIDLDAEIANKEAQMLEMYEEIEALKAQKESETK